MKRDVRRALLGASSAAVSGAASVTPRSTAPVEPQRACQPRSSDDRRPFACRRAAEEARPARWHPRILLRFLSVSVLFWPINSATVEEVCEHEYYQEVDQSTEIPEGHTIFREILSNQTQRYFYRNFGVTTMNLPDERRKLIINLEPCRGVVYLMVRKTRHCYPDPYSCMLTLPRSASDCEWTHFMSEIDGSRDGAPTFFEVPLSSTKYYIAVYATTTASYTLTLLSDIGAFPRPGQYGRITARQLRELQVEISWKAAYYLPNDVTTTKQYWIYSAMLLSTDSRLNMNVFLRPDKVMNTVCGLQNNTDQQYSRIPASQCERGVCNATIDGVITDKRYVFNVVVESQRGYYMAYAGVIMNTNWTVIRQATSDQALRVIGAVSGSVLGMVVIIYALMLKLYG